MCHDFVRYQSQQVGSRYMCVYVWANVRHIMRFFIWQADLNVKHAARRTVILFVFPLLPVKKTLPGALHLKKPPLT